MKNRLIKEILLWGGIFCSHMLLQAQVAGDVANVKFEEVENPVPKQAAVGGNKGTNSCRLCFNTHPPFLPITWTCQFLNTSISLQTTHQKKHPYPPPSPTPFHSPTLLI